jgi:hypothetical protein
MIYKHCHFCNKKKQKRRIQEKRTILLVSEGFDVEAESGTDNAGVLPINSQHNGSLARIVKPTASTKVNQPLHSSHLWSKKQKTGNYYLHHEYTYFLLLPFNFSNNAEKPHLFPQKVKTR